MEITGLLVNDMAAMQHSRRLKDDLSRFDNAARELIMSLSVMTSCLIDQTVAEDTLQQLSQSISQLAPIQEQILTLCKNIELYACSFHEEPELPPPLCLPLDL